MGEVTEEEVVTIEYLDTPEKQEIGIIKLMASMGFEIVTVGGEEYLRPTDPEHPDFAKSSRKIERARKAVDRVHDEDDRPVNSPNKTSAQGEEA